MDLYLSKPGVMSCAGNNIDELWQSVTGGNQRGIKKVTACNGEEYFAARIDDAVLKPSTSRYEMKIMRIENAALEQIKDDVEAVVSKYGAERVAVCVGSCDNGTEFSLAGHRKYFAEEKFPADYSLEIQGADYVATFVAEKFGLRGPVNTFSTACSSSAGAIIKAAEMIKGGIVDAAVVGGIDIASDTTLIGFSALEAVSSEITNPFSKNRHGITLGDGAAFFVLTKDAPVVEPVETTAALSVLNLKIPLISASQMTEILKLPGVRLLNQTNDLAAKQEREKGFCECIIVAEEKSVLHNAVARFEELFPGDAIILQAKKIIEEKDFTVSEV